MKFDDYRVRRQAIRWLSHSRDARAIEPVMAALNDRSYEVRKAAAQALGDFGGASALAPLITLAEGTLHYPMAKIAVHALQNVLGRSAFKADGNDLEAAAELDDVCGLFRKHAPGVGYFTEESQTRPWKVDCSRIRTLASREIVRRAHGDGSVAAPAMAMRTQGVSL